MTVLFATLIYLFTLLSPDQSALLRVIVLYDKDRDGLEEGVGPGVPVWIRKEAGEEIQEFTNNSSEARFIVNYGTWFARAEVKSTRFFFIWVCEGSRFVSNLQEFLILYCYERFFIRLPFMQGGILSDN